MTSGLSQKPLRITKQFRMYDLRTHMTSVTIWTIDVSVWLADVNRSTLASLVGLIMVDI